MDADSAQVSRRRLLQVLLGLPALAALSAGVREAAAAETLLATAGTRTATPTPDCGDDDEPTPPETEGPFFRPRSPLRTSLIEPGVEGHRLFLSGRVYGTACHPVAGALLDFWHADDRGEYDNQGFRCRGHQFTDADGRFRLTTIVPGLYEPRTRHIHVKVQAPHGRVLTTQLYFPGEPRNRTDPLFRSDLLVATRDVAPGREARFNFVLRS